MTFEQLAAFVAAVEEPTFFDAAEKLHMTQSTLSKQVIKLEKELGMTLLDRSHRKARPTPAGRLFYDEARGLLARYREAMEKMQDFRERTDHRLRVGTLPVQAQFGLSARFHAFTAAHPDVALTIQEEEEAGLLEGLEADRYDTILCRESLVPPPRFQSCPVADDHAVAVLAPENPLARKTAVTLEDLAGEDLFLMHANTSIYRDCLAAFTHAGLQPHVKGTGRPETIISAALGPKEAALIPACAMTVLHMDHIVLRPVAPPIAFPLVLAWKAGAERPAALAAFRRFLLAAASGA